MLFHANIYEFVIQIRSYRINLSCLKWISLRNIHSYPQRFWLLHLVLPLILAALLVWVYPRVNLDVFLINAFYDPAALTFPLKNDWFLENIMHLGLKYLMVAISLTVLGLWVLGLKTSTALMPLFSQRFSWISTYHRQFIWVFVAMLISTTTISVLKHLSNHACPWDLLLYGGTQPYIPLFGQLPAGATPGHCFPGGHASGGFALLAFYFAFRETEPNLAKLGLLAGMIFGFAMGWAQMIRGAHFMSHNLWTAWIVWMILLVQYLLCAPKK